MAGGHGHEPLRPRAPRLAVWRRAAGRRARNGMRSMITKDSDGPGRRHLATATVSEQGRGGVGGEPLDQGGGAVVALAQHRCGQPVPHSLAAAAPHASTRQPSVRPRQRRQGRDLVQLLDRAGPSRPGGGRWAAT
ncbi:hypothetical protein I553_3316 [Mycobacterium xenopi 4042]|uniref:Uncharacterized protein n=1 Tax=Mycobacterium xenopi 4042 TaxID=1299334 RepID=X8CLN3_MYCXE|nr:hypothetical protein I553_3316 [Mycobacterium xenopi 4042]